MATTILRSEKAPKLEGITPGQSYLVTGCTDGNAIIVNDNAEFYPVSYGLIYKDGWWSIDKSE